MIERICLLFQQHLHFVIHDCYTFAAVLALGALQTIVALDSGYLAVKALNDLSKPKRWVQISFLAATGIAIIVVTILIGHLADANQWDANQRATRAEASWQQIQDAQSSTKSDVDKANGKLDLISDLTNQKVLTPEDLVQLRKEVNSAKDSLNSALRAAGPVSISVNGTPLTSTPQTPISNPNPQSIDRASARREIEKTKDDLRSIDNDTQHDMPVIMTSMKGAYVQAYMKQAQLHPEAPGTLDPETQHDLDSTFQRFLVPPIKTGIKSREDRFQQLVPAINSERMHALQLLNLSPAEATADANAFNAALNKSTEKVEIPDSWQKANYLTGLNFRPMSDYLSSLDQKLSAKK